MKLTKAEKKLYLLCASLPVAIFGVVFWWRANNVDIVIPAPVMPNPNAYDYYVKAINAHVPQPSSIDPAIDPRPTPANPAELAKRYPPAPREAWLRANAGSLNLLREGFHYSCWTPPIRSWNYPSVNAGFSVYAGFRELARMLAVESHAGQARNDWKGAATSALDCIKFGTDIRQGAPIIASLTGCAVVDMGRQELWKIAPHLSAQEARAVAARLERIVAATPTTGATLEEEKWVQLAQLKLSEMRSAPWVATGYSAFYQRRLRFYTRATLMRDEAAYFDELIAQAKQPYSSARPISRNNHSLWTNLISASGRTRFVFTRHESATALLLVALALRAYRQEHARYPSTLDALVPSYTKQIPRDPFGSGEALHYRGNGASYTLWSIGPDGVDNGGMPIDNKPAAGETFTESKRRRVQQESTGDMVAGINLP